MDNKKVSTKDYALECSEKGLSVIPCFQHGDKKKRPSIAWKPYQERRAGKEEIENWFSDDEKYGLGIVCGKVSGNFIAIDIDKKNDETGTIDQKFFDKVTEQMLSVFDAGILVGTPSGGSHFYLRCESEIGRNEKLACTKDGKVLIETRAEGGYVLTYPSDGYVVHGHEAYEVPTISKRDLDALLDIARSFDEQEQAVNAFSQTANKSATTGVYDVNTVNVANISDGDSIFEAFNKKQSISDVIGILTRNGWKYLYENEIGVSHLERPTKNEGSTSATVGYDSAHTIDKGYPRTYVFSTSTTLKDNKNLKPSEVRCELEFGGNWANFAEQLRKEGFEGRKPTKSEEDGRTSQEEKSIKEDCLKKLIDTEKRLSVAMKNPIEFSKPFLTQKETPVFYPQTINLIQGQAGTHKSRLTEIICSALLKKENCDSTLLEFKKQKDFCVVYVDTERNLSEQFPYSLQKIQERAGYGKSEDTPNFRFTSLLEIPRTERFGTLKKYLEEIKRETKTPLFVVLDVSTDCLEDFNKVDGSLELIDLMNTAVNTYDVAFLCLIHENPNDSAKARGHFGTELMNKSSTAIQVKFRKDENGESSELLQVKYLKCRNNKKPPSFHCKWSDTEKVLSLVDESEVPKEEGGRIKKAQLSDVYEQIQSIMQDGRERTKTELFGTLTELFSTTDDTILDRMKKILSGSGDIKNEFTVIDDDRIFRLEKKTVGKEAVYYLKPLDE